MCGRYYIEMDDAELQNIVSTVEQRVAVKTGEVFPTNIAPVISAEGIPTAMRWGFPRFDGKGEIINARSETAGEKATFRRSFIESRCLVPASYYFEWEKRENKKVKYALEPADGSLSWLAGLSQRDQKTGEERFVILTRPAWEGISFIHDRMPVIFRKEWFDEWLNGHDPIGTMERAVNEVTFRTA